MDSVALAGKGLQRLKRRVGMDHPPRLGRVEALELVHETAGSSPRLRRDSE